mmetsp:Transcript_10014/g.40446  ORF Transcript_10014/g.40446 Transcript_10014/m.40446 type:complete len:249 (-) Transcript_10014:1297-2043(-)
MELRRHILGALDAQGAVERFEPDAGGRRRRILRKLAGDSRGRATGGQVAVRGLLQGEREGQAELPRDSETAETDAGDDHPAGQRQRRRDGGGLSGSVIGLEASRVAERTGAASARFAAEGRVPHPPVVRRATRFNYSNRWRRKLNETINFNTPRLAPYNFWSSGLNSGEMFGSSSHLNRPTTGFSDNTMVKVYAMSSVHAALTDTEASFPSVVHVMSYHPVYLATRSNTAMCITKGYSVLAPHLAHRR